VAELSPVLESAMRSLEDHPLVSEVRGGIGLIAGIQLTPEVDGDALTRRCVDAGVIIRMLGGNVIQISPPFVIEPEDLRRVADVIRAGLDAAGRAPIVGHDAP
jgi:adenosylmethionine-8-amino-7-oxononanoate aminotransferase